MTIANGKIYVASKDTHELYCLDESTGEIQCPYWVNNYKPNCPVPKAHILPFDIAQ